MSTHPPSTHMLPTGVPVWKHPELVGASRRKQSQLQSPLPGPVSPCSAQRLLPDAEVAVGLATPCGDSRWRGGGGGRTGGRQGTYSWGKQSWPPLRGSGLCLGVQRLLGQGSHGQSTTKPRAWGAAVGLMLSHCKIPLLRGSHPLPSCSGTERDPKVGAYRAPWGGLGISLEVMAALGPGCPQAGGHDPHSTIAVPYPGLAETIGGDRGVP